MKKIASRNLLNVPPNKSTIIYYYLLCSHDFKNISLLLMGPFRLAFMTTLTGHD